MDKPRTSHSASDDEVEAVIAEFGGDPKAAIKALLHDIALLADDHTASVSWGYVRGKLWVVKGSKKA